MTATLPPLAPATAAATAAAATAAAAIARPGPAERLPEARPAVDWSAVRRAHLIGIGGSAMGNFAGLLKAHGVEVRGSDAGVFDPMATNLRNLGIPVATGYDAAHLDWGPDVVIVGNVSRRDNPEAVAMRERGLPYASFPEALGEWLLPRRLPVVITGTHGKTTTTSLTAWLLDQAGRDPGLLVGGVPLNFGTSFRPGSDGAPFVIEGDEYDTAYYDKRPKFVHYRPHHAILTSVEFDHADIYPDLAAVERAFALLARLVAADGLLVAWGEDPRVLAAAAHARCRVLRYGLAGDAAAAAALGLDIWAEQISLGQGGARFVLARAAGVIGAFQMQIPGLHNIRNAVAALATVLDLGVSVADAVAGLASFRGTRKRQELRGEVGAVAVIDDYAHHPTAVRETVAAIRAAWPGRRLWALFEAESNTSRRSFFQDDYVEAFASAGADRVVFCSPLRKAADATGAGASDGSEYLDCERLVAALRDRGVRADYLPEVPEIVALVAAEAAAGDVVLAMSGRDFRGLHGLLLQALAQRP